MCLGDGTPQTCHLEAAYPNIYGIPAGGMARTGSKGHLIAGQVGIGHMKGMKWQKTRKNTAVSHLPVPGN